MYTDTKISNREVTSAIELSMEQCEVKPQIGSLLDKESSHALDANGHGTNNEGWESTTHKNT